MLLVAAAIAAATPGREADSVLLPAAGSSNATGELLDRPQNYTAGQSQNSVTPPQRAVLPPHAATGTIRLSDASLNDASITWMMLSTAIVLMMTPALGLFEAGLLPDTYTVSVLMQCVSGLAILSVLWFCIGFTLCFGASAGGVIGSPASYPFMLDVTWAEALEQAPAIPGILFALFQCMFAVITPLLITGAFAGRLKYGAFVMFIVCWSVIVYYPLVHWVWCPSGFLAKLGVFDFAGGIVIHTSAGVASLVCALTLDAREEPSPPPHSLPMATVGATLLWGGWFGFNGGSALAAGTLASSAIFNTHIAASSSAVTWVAFEAASQRGCGGKPTLAGALNGAVAGLAGITPASGFVTTQAAFVLGVVFGLGALAGSWALKRLRIDDALEVSAVHGVTGIIGSLALGLLATQSVNPDGPDGALYGRPQQLGYQAIGVLVAIAWAAPMTAAILQLVRVTVGLRHEPIELLPQPAQPKGADAATAAKQKGADAAITADTTATPAVSLDERDHGEAAYTYSKPQHVSYWQQ